MTYLSRSARTISSGLQLNTRSSGRSTPGSIVHITALRVADQREVVAICEQRGVARNFDDPAKTKDADFKHPLSECLAEQFATKRTIDVVDRDDGVIGD